MRSPLFIAGAVVVLLGFGGLAAWRGSWLSSPTRGPAQPLKILVSGDTQGWITPCGCASNQSGGLLRRGALVRAEQLKHDVIVLDAGGAAGGTSPYDRAKFEAIIRGEGLMQLSAHNLGGSELALGPQYLRDVAKRTGAAFVSANATDQQGQRIASPFRYFEAAGKRIVVLGVASAKYATGEIQLSDPQTAILKAREELTGGYDWLIVLAYMPEDELRALAAALPEADAIIGGPTGQAIAPEKIGPVLVAAATNKGKFLVALERGSEDKTWRGAVVEMSAALPDDPAQVKNVARFRQALGERDFAAIESGLLNPLAPLIAADVEVAGTDACRDCHGAEFAAWQASGHAHAWPTLTAQGAHVDSSCQQCHTTGFGLVGGFVSARRSERMTNVGCESCHGPSELHAEDPSRRTPVAASDSCVRCHDAENSPQFDYGTYWPKIAHGASEKE